MDYKKAYEAEKKLNVNLSNMLEDEEDISFERYGIIRDLEEKLTGQTNMTVVISLATLVIGVLIGLFL